MLDYSKLGKDKLVGDKAAGPRKLSKYELDNSPEHFYKILLDIRKSPRIEGKSRAFIEGIYMRWNGKRPNYPVTCLSDLSEKQRKWFDDLEKLVYAVG